MPHKGISEIPGYGIIRQFAGAAPSGGFRVVRVNINFGDGDGLKLVNDVLDKMTRVKIREKHGEATSMTISLSVDCRGIRGPQAYACKTREEFVELLKATATKQKRQSNRDYKHVRTPAQRGGLPVPTR